ncbi:MAG: hypothetical protein K6T83_07055 [Alicyclobacillus sp.]|nr:hypothetical protein [Alicyclobacillus sp.]
MKERLTEILKALSEGKTREEVARQYGYKSRKHMDQYMRRHGYRWGAEQGTYTLDANRRKTRKVSARALRVIAQFRNPSADAKEIAKRLGFANHLAMAQYMQTQGYVWAAEVNNYVPRDREEVSDQLLSVDDTPTEIHPGDYLHILGVLIKHEKKLMRLLTETVSPIHEIPRYVLPGAYIVKSIHMSAELDELVRRFSREKNISQREIFEVAIIHFLQRYGYAASVDTLFQRSSANAAPQFR